MRDGETSMKPRIPQEFFINDDLGELSPLHRLLFLGLLALASDEDGILEDRPKRIQAQVLPYDREADVNAMLDDLQEYGLIARHNGDRADEAEMASGATMLSINAF